MSAVASCFEILYQDKERNGAILDYILNLGQRYYDAFFADARYTAYLEGIKNTLIISLFAVLLGVLLGVLVAVVKYVAKGSKNPVIRFLDKVQTLCNSNQSYPGLSSDLYYRKPYFYCPQYGNLCRNYLLRH